MRAGALRPLPAYSTREFYIYLTFLNGLRRPPRKALRARPGGSAGRPGGRYAPSGARARNRKCSSLDP